MSKENKVKLVIEVDKKIIETLKTDCLDFGEIHEVEVAIANGIPYEERPQGDLISREALKEKLNKKALDLANGGMIFIESIKQVIDDAPTVDCYTFKQVKELFDLNVQMANEIENLKRPQGEWNYIQAGMAVCPFCGADPHKDYKNFCPNCGADMRGSAE